MKAASDYQEVRKVQFTGRSTYVLSLPKKWVKEMDLVAGTPVTIVRELNNSLSIIPNPNPADHLEPADKVTAVILPSEGSSTIRRKVVSMYLAGYKVFT